MKPVMQTILTPPNGNCFPACLASILEVEIDDVPNFHGDGWFEKYQNWLLERFGLFIYETVPSDYGCHPWGYYIGVGRSPRGDYDHAVVMNGKDVAHDPHPEGGLHETFIHTWELLQFVEPRR